MSGALGLPVEVSEELVPAGGGTQAVAEYFARSKSAGIDHLAVLVDPQTVAAVEELGEALRLYRNR